MAQFYTVLSEKTQNVKEKYIVGYLKKTDKGGFYGILADNPSMSFYPVAQEDGSYVLYTKKEYENQIGKTEVSWYRTGEMASLESGKSTLFFYQNPDLVYRVVQSSEPITRGNELNIARD